MKRIAIALLLGLMLLLAGCSTAPQEEVERKNSVGNTSVTQIVGEMPSKDGVYRFTDEETGATCYVYKDSMGDAGAGGISCLNTPSTEEDF